MQKHCSIFFFLFTSYKASSLETKQKAVENLSDVFGINLILGHKIGIQGHQFLGDALVNSSGSHLRALTPED